MRVPASSEYRKFTISGGLNHAIGRVIWQASPPEDGATVVLFLDRLVAGVYAPTESQRRGRALPQRRAGLSPLRADPDALQAAIAILLDYLRADFHRLAGIRLVQDFCEVA
jgi:hypothetical protein